MSPGALCADQTKRTTVTHRKEFYWWVGKPLWTAFKGQIPGATMYARQPIARVKRVSVNRCPAHVTLATSTGFGADSGNSSNFAKFGASPTHDGDRGTDVL